MTVLLTLPFKNKNQSSHMPRNCITYPLRTAKCKLQRKQTFASFQLLYTVDKIFASIFCTIAMSFALSCRQSLMRHVCNVTPYTIGNSELASQPVSENITLKQSPFLIYRYDTKSSINLLYSRLTIHYYIVSAYLQLFLIGRDFVTKVLFQNNRCTLHCTVQSK